MLFSWNFVFLMLVIHNKCTIQKFRFLLFDFFVLTLGNMVFAKIPDSLDLGPNSDSGLRYGYAATVALYRFFWISHSSGHLIIFYKRLTRGNRHHATGSERQSRTVPTFMWISASVGCKFGSPKNWFLSLVPFFSMFSSDSIGWYPDPGVNSGQVTLFVS